MEMEGWLDARQQRKVKWSRGWGLSRKDTRTFASALHHVVHSNRSSRRRDEVERGKRGHHSQLSTIRVIVDDISVTSFSRRHAIECGVFEPTVQMATRTPAYSG
jgi:hypothetical protein